MFSGHFFTVLFVYWVLSLIYERPTANILNGEKLTALPLMSGTGMSTLTIVVQHSTGSPRLSHKTTKGNKSIQISKEEVKLSLFTDNMICILCGKPKRLHQKPARSDILIQQSQDIKSMYRNHLHFYTPIMKQQKEKSRNQSHLQLHQKP